MAQGRLAGKTALITGGAAGFGQAIAERFAEEGARVGVLDINGDGADAVARAIGNAATAFRCDVANHGDVMDTAQAVIAAFGEIDIVVNNAGWSHPNSPALDHDEATFDKVMAVNVKSIFNFTHAFVPHWRAIGHGVMINIGSTAGLRPRPGLSWYNASKGAVTTLSKSLAVELAPDRIRVCAIAPVMGETQLLETFMGGPDTPQQREKFVASIPLGRLSLPRDIANAALYLASDEAEFMTGVNLEVDGGRCV